MTDLSLKFTNKKKGYVMGRKKRRTKEEKLYYAKQKACGIALLAVGIATALLTGDATIDIILFPVGLYLVFTNDKAMMF